MCTRMSIYGVFHTIETNHSVRTVENRKKISLGKLYVNGFE